MGHKRLRDRRALKAPDLIILVGTSALEAIRARPAADCVSRERPNPARLERETAADRPILSVVDEQYVGEKRLEADLAKVLSGP